MADSNQPETTAPTVQHVLHVVAGEVLYRVGPMFTQVVTGLSSRGVRVAVVTDSRQALNRLRGTPLEGHHVPHLSGWRAWGLDTRLAAQLGPLPELAHLWGQAESWWLQRWADRAGVPLIVHVFGERHLERLLRHAQRGDLHLAIASGVLAERIGARHPLASRRCHRIVPAVMPPPPEVEPPRERRTFGLLCVSRLAANCGAEVLVDAVAQLRRAGTDLAVAIIGRGPAQNAIWRRVRARGVLDCVSVIDEPQLWEPVLPEVDALVLPACERELSVVPLLAMALGKVVIASRDQIAEWFVEDRTAWQFTPGSAVELAYLLSRAVENPRHGEALGRTAAAYVRAHHAIPRLIDQLLACYAEVVAARGSSAAGPGEQSGERVTC